MLEFYARADDNATLRFRFTGPGKSSAAYGQYSIQRIWDSAEVYFNAVYLADKPAGFELLAGEHSESGHYGYNLGCFWQSGGEDDVWVR